MAGETPAGALSAPVPAPPPQLLATKLHMPPARPNLLPRPQLIARLQAVLLVKLILISAPAGFGKTTVALQFLLTGAKDRDTQSLSGQWTYSKDLYKQGLNDINGWVAKSRMQRYRDIDVAAEEAKGGIDFYEFDMERGPLMTLPGAWNAAEPELRYYDGLIWFQKKFTPKALNGGRAFS